ncbi:DUF2828 family protein [Mycolicibacterium sp. S2-37]|uniref:DUF2828 family protein n=1 Tax=Mycolicibacterium sp. S2-37 TaxID=2810297 RepID=UPI001A93C97D|nr:DUF2828 family protein [Mycolicibacterium sp. S2-37]MBO0676916.1 DUF2828 family protein [Mycolicibacterium sp. S2-37]
MTTFLDALRVTTNRTTTENGAVTNKSTLDPVVDFFSLAGAMRSTPERAADLFDKAYDHDPQTALRTLFYLRDVRGGQGEREIFRAGMRRYAVARPGSSASLLDQIASFERNLALIPEYGRWDDLFFNGVTDPVVEIVRDQLNRDILADSTGEPVSLLAKWLPSENASSKVTKARARELANALGLTYRQYRKTLSKLRARIRLLEQDMSANRWDEIEYGKLPSQAHRKHVKAFERHNPDKYAAYLASVEKGEAKINVSTVFPHEIYQMCDNGSGSITDNAYANAAWENLADFTNGQDALVMADTSGSMVRPWESANPIAVSVALALYFAERNKGHLKGYFMTFSQSPSLIKVAGTTLAARLRNIQQAPWGMNTNMLAAFRAILAAAMRAGELPPKVLYVVSDMEFDHSGIGHHDTVFETARREFAEAGVPMPHVVFWNVAARNMQAPATVLDGAVSLVSGCSPTIFAQAVEGKTPRELVDQVVNSERYERITA